MTCAHVVGERDARMWVEFAENPGIPPVGARVAPGGWLPGPDRAAGEDVAVLALDSPRPQAAPAPLGRGWSGAARCGSAGTPRASTTGCG